MPVDKLKVAIRTPIDQIPVGRGFYQLEEDALYVQIAPWDSDHRFFSFIESETARLDIDKTGALLFVEVSEARRNWPVQEKLVIPRAVAPADIRWTDFRSTVADPTLLADPTKEHLQIRYSSEDPAFAYEIAGSVLVQVTADNIVTSIWITDIIDDLAGQEIAAFRKAMQPHARTRT